MFGFRGDADRRDQLFAVALLRQHLDDREILRVVERELGAQQRPRVEPLALAITQVALHQPGPQEILGDGGRAEPVALAGLERDEGARLARFRVHLQVAAREAGVEIAVGGRGAQQLALQAVVVEVAQARVGPERRVREHLRQERLVAPAPVISTCCSTRMTGSPGAIAMRACQTPSTCVSSVSIFGS